MDSFEKSLVWIADFYKWLQNNGHKYESIYNVSWAEEWMASGFSIKFLRSFGCPDMCPEVEVVCIFDWLDYDNQNINDDSAYGVICIRATLRNVNSSDYHNSIIKQIEGRPVKFEQIGEMFDYINKELYPVFKKKFDDDEESDINE